MSAPSPHSSGGKPTVSVAHPSDLLTDHLPNGDGLVAFGFMREPARRGYRLHVATRRAELRDPLPANVTLHPIRPRSRGSIGRLHSICCLLRTLRRAEPIDIVHQMNPVFAGLPIVLGAYVARWPGGEARDAGRGLPARQSAVAGRWLINLAQQTHASALLVTTPAAMNRISLPRIARRKCRLVRHAIDETLFAPPPGWQKAARTDEPTIPFYSHLDRRKGVFVLVDAFQEVARAIPSCRLVIVGRGDHAEDLKAHIAASEHAARIVVADKIEYSAAYELLGRHSVYCLPSFGEPYGMTALEAMGCARPLIITNTGGLNDLPPENGAVRVPPGDAAALTGVLRSPELRLAMGSANRDFVERHCTWRQVVDDLAAVCAAVLPSSAVIALDRPGFS